jgi:hypothetical protein
VAGAVLLDDHDDNLGVLRPGEVIEVSVSSRTQMHAFIAELCRSLRLQHLTAVPVGRLMRDAGASV